MILRRSCATAALAALALVAGGTTRAATLAPSLAGETLSATGNTNILTIAAGGGDFGQNLCRPDGDTTIPFTQSGVATGPYPGTFTETGTVTIGPQTIPNIQTQWYGLNTGPLTTFHASFEIDSAAGVVRGTKDLSVRRGSQGYRTTFSDHTIGIVLDAHGEIGEFDAWVDYQATIRNADGTFRDSGFGLAGGGEQSVVGTVDGAPYGTGGSGFSESFFSSDGVVPLGPATVTLSPAAAVNNIGTSHTVTAAVGDALGGPVAGTPVLFTVTGAAATTGSCTTGSTGQCSFTYPGPSLPGSDVITACADANGNGVVDAGEPCGTATKTWVGPATAAACKDGAFLLYGAVFKNEGDCVSFVATGGRNPPAGA